MKTEVLFSLLLVCSLSAASLIGDVKEIGSGLVEDAKTVARASEMFIFDRNSKLVLVNMDKDDPETVEETKKVLPNRVSYYLYTRETGAKAPQQLKVNDTDALLKSVFDPKRPTVLITHGWTQNYTYESCTLVRDAYLKHGDYNVILVDWGSLSQRPYMWSSRRALLIARLTAQLIDFLAQNGLNPNTTTVVGHSLGAHVAGLSSHYAKQKVNYVVGLDPAEPGFWNVGAGLRIAKGDANYVQIIHTNGGMLGFMEAIGDADFYVNGGSAQKGCVFDINGTCSHYRSYQVFAEAINSPVGFLAVPCDSYSKFKKGACSSNPSVRISGAEPNLNVTGVFYLDTNSTAPYALGAQGLK